MVSNRNDGGSTYIYLSGDLLDKNKEIWNNLTKKYPNNFYKGTYRKELRIQIADTTKMTEKEISDAFVKIANLFKVQDVNHNFYQTSEDYLIECGCYEEIPNPEYVEISSLMPTVGNLEEIDKWFKQISCPKTKKVFNKNKMNKSFEEYVKENGDENRTDFETGKVYESPYFLKRHLEYVELKNTDIVGV